MKNSGASYSGPLVIWLFTGCFLVFGMVVVGGITRLTGSGLSITEWNVIMGALPPMHEADWQEVFEKYQASPQFQKLNYHFNLADFKKIFWWEYIHRLIGRIIGIVFIVPFSWFYLKGQISKKLLPRLLFIFALGGLQGFIGWYMVKSGLVNNPHVSHYRLAIHLITAFATFGFILWTALDLIYPKSENTGMKGTGIYKTAVILFGMVCLQIIYGAFVAGLKAGMLYGTFPKMGDEWMASSVSIAFENDGILSLFENPASVQFIHRCVAWSLVIVYGLLLLLVNKNKSVFKSYSRQVIALNGTGAVLVLQFLLGMFTLLYQVPVALGVLHQAGAFFLFAAVLLLLHALRRGAEVRV